MKISEYGNLNGQPVVYFHGVPGSPAEVAVFNEYAQQANFHIICFDRFAIDASIQGQDYYQHISDAIIKKIPNEKIHMIGFSMGCHVAIEVSLLLKERVGQLHLISAAAPLEGGDYINQMAGKAVFNIAMKQPFIFTLLSYWQVLLAKLSVNVLFNMLFASAQAEDKKLCASPKFKEFIRPILKASFQHNVSGYIRDIRQYVSPWQQSVRDCETTTHLWHGKADNWSPLAMAEYLEGEMKKVASVTIMEGLSHYSCLYEASPEIVKCLAVEIKNDS